MITSSIPPHVLKGTFKVASDVKATSAVQMNVRLNTTLLEKNASNDDTSIIEDSVNINSNGCTHYYKACNTSELEFCHEHLLDIKI